MTPRLRWPNVEKAMVTYLTEQLEIPIFTKTGTTTTATIIRFGQIERSGGSTEWISKHVDISISVTADTREAMWDLAADAETAFFALAATAAGGIYVDDVAETFGFAFDPPDDPSIRRASAIYTLTVRPIRED